MRHKDIENSVDYRDEIIMLAKLSKLEAEATIRVSNKNHHPFNMTDSYTLLRLASEVLRLLEVKK